jgi:hypothetical protein
MERTQKLRGGKKIQKFFNFGSPWLFTVTFRESRSNIHL